MLAESFGSLYNPLFSIANFSATYPYGFQNWPFDALHQVALNLFLGMRRVKLER
jgi:hypothetical protein